MVYKNSPTSGGASFSHFKKQSPVMLLKLPKNMADLLVGDLNVAKKYRKHVLLNADITKFQVSTNAPASELSRNVNSLLFKNVSEYKCNKYY